MEWWHWALVAGGYALAGWISVVVFIAIWGRHDVFIGEGGPPVVFGFVFWPVGWAWVFAWFVLFPVLGAGYWLLICPGDALHARLRKHQCLGCSRRIPFKAHFCPSCGHKATEGPKSLRDAEWPKPVWPGIVPEGLVEFETGIVEPRWTSRTGSRGPR